MTARSLSSEPPAGPGFFDVQVNGYGGVDLNADDLSAEQMDLLCQRLEADGTTAVLATIVTDSLDRMCARLARIVRLREQLPGARRVIAGFHIEGPFINATTGYRGAHPEAHVLPPTVAAADRLLEAASGLARLVTLAPEKDEGFAVTRHLAGRGVVVAAGHCNPTFDELRRAVDAGLSMFTHLGNGCPAMLPRHDNIIQWALSLRQRLWLCFVGDGVHVPLPALGNYLRAADPGRTIVVTDAIWPAGLGPGTYNLWGFEVKVGDDLAARDPRGPNLMGSVATMPFCYANLTDKLGLSAAHARRLTCQNPRAAFGL